MGQDLSSSKSSTWEVDGKVTHLGGHPTSWCERDQVLGSHRLDWNSFPPHPIQHVTLGQSVPLYNPQCLNLSNWSEYPVKSHMERKKCYCTLILARESFPGAGKDWRQKEKGTAEGEMVRWPDSMDRNLSKLWEIVVDRGTPCHIHWVAKSWTWLSEWTTTTGQRRSSINPLIHPPIHPSVHSFLNLLNKYILSSCWAPWLEIKGCSSWTKFHATVDNFVW